jgi:Fe-S-cluster containining protein
MEDTAAQLREEIRRGQEILDQQAADLAEVRAGLNLLIEVLVARGDLGAAHPGLIERVKRQARRPDKKTVHLGIYEDKYQLANSDVDCPSLVHLCKARCCTFSIKLTRQDVEEGMVKWEIDDPYLIRHERDGYCSHLDRASGGCTGYPHRPGTCRVYDCRQDRRVWIDFEKRIPAPMPLGVVAIATP